MKFSKATNYALHTMLFLAMDSSKKFVGVQDLAEKQHVSPTYLSKILTKLAKEGMINSSSGATGVIRLVKIGKIFHSWTLYMLLKVNQLYLIAA